MTRGQRLAFAGLLVPVVIALIGLGVWQIERRSWKLALIAQVERNLAAPPVDAQKLAVLPSRLPDHVYRRVRARGTFVTGRIAFVQAVTDLGPGYWLMQPLRIDRGDLLINRGFVPSDMRRQPIATPIGIVEVRGLLRLSEPGGGFLRSNRPEEDRWYSRDVTAIAAHMGLAGVAPYFLDAEAAPAPQWPRGGLTVVRFRNAHLQYALTWFTLAAGLAIAAGWVALKGGPE